MVGNLLLDEAALNAARCCHGVLFVVWWLSSVDFLTSILKIPVLFVPDIRMPTEALSCI